MKIGICDDNQLYLNKLIELVTKHAVDSIDTDIVAVKPDEIFSFLEKNTFPFDILITDIDMGDFNGIEFAKEINRIHSSCIIIFISNYLNFATEVYEVKHTYFVLKSEAEQRLPKALDKAFSIYQEGKNNFITFRYQNVRYHISLNDISHIEALGRYVYIHSVDQFYKCIDSLKDISQKLSDNFVRCHNSFIVNLNYVHSVSRTNCVLTSGVDIPISYTYSKSFQAAYVKFVSNRLMQL